MTRIAVRGLVFNIAFQSAMLMLDLDYRLWWSVAVLFPIFVMIDVLYIWASRRSHRYFEELRAALDQAFDRMQQRAAEQPLEVDLIHSDGTTTSHPIVGLPRPDGTTEWGFVDDIAFLPGDAISGFMLGPGDTFHVAFDIDATFECP